MVGKTCIDNIKTVKYLPINTRIIYGKQIENEVLNILEKKGYRVKIATYEEDTIDKIDAFIGRKTNTLRPLQVKYRDSGSEFIMEMLYLDDENGVTKVLSRNMNLDGRDFLSKSELYACYFPKRNIIKMCELSQIKRHALYACDRLLVKYINFNEKKYVTKYGKAMVVTDPSSKRRKILFFCKSDPDLIRSLVEIRV